jgi:peptidoglycan/LPS O-acetylase OafA/YrhL
MTESPTELQPIAPPGAKTGRVSGLDGLRGLAALYVMLHHTWLNSFDGFPENHGPWWTGWLLYGHFGVVVFIVLSGFSLGVSPARKGWRLGGVGRFAKRRAWRILPPYWAALVFSLIVAWAIIPAPGELAPTLKSVLVYGTLFQDAVGAPAPNGAFWSIAIEFHLYFLFPLLLLSLRRIGPIITLTAVTVVVAMIGGLAPHVSAADALMRFVPQLAVLFAMGVVAAGVVAAKDRLRNVPWHWLAAVAALPVLGLIVFKGSVFVAGKFFWVDLALGPAVAMLLAAVATNRPAPLVRVLDSRPLRRLGSFSYSLYLVHAPIVWVIRQKVAGPLVPAGVPTFLVTLSLSIVVAIPFAWLFAKYFELPFQRHRDWSALREAIGLRRPAVRGYRPAHQRAAASPHTPQPQPVDAGGGSHE